MARRSGSSARSIEARENQLVNLAIDLAEQRLRDGTATSQLLCHYLKLGSTREKLEQENLHRKNDVLRAQADALDADSKREDRYKEAINAMMRYSGSDENY